MLVKLQFAVSRASLIFQKSFPDDVISYHRPYITSTWCTSSNLATTSQRKCPFQNIEKNDHENHPTLYIYPLGKLFYKSRVERKPAFCKCENKDAYHLRGNREADFATQIVQSLYFLNPKFQASSHLL